MPIPLSISGPSTGFRSDSSSGASDLGRGKDREGTRSKCGGSIRPDAADGDVPQKITSDFAENQDAERAGTRDQREGSSLQITASLLVLPRSRAPTSLRTPIWRRPFARMPAPTGSMFP